MTAQENPGIPARVHLQNLETLLLFVEVNTEDLGDFLAIEIFVAEFDQSGFAEEFLFLFAAAEAIYV
ncbi:hypothetical protein [Nocardia terpenica]|uniref:Uncharacterized protein n=1 Tax=Nocardia terpenica TaxID=455432 RepID=A0A164IQ33_9NOCA|nr:hypothetical protein [Nocardia terpenica]KZM69650.1 hypothetical protein AWN90_07695 [Nocardia terpenica]NQE89329.1 hypothetical protein [Nocardia terpenica]